ncbi:MAG: UDP-N-acetylmuramate--L-alanine ligase, partial [Clostridia bacterium]|nr:UDP-N-acetylmuramate--L-alanine ligase [Clostridia bacterium]
KTMDNLVASFAKFINMSSICYYNGDDELSNKAVKDFGGKRVSFGFKDTNDYYAADITKGKYGFCYNVMSKGECIAKIILRAPGRHNVLNSLAAFAVCYDSGVPAKGIADALESFTGAGRRFEFIGEYEKFTLADDYAHHPTEIKATLTAAKELDYKKVTVVFQPFTFSRTALLKDEFIEALSVADRVVLTPIMGSREINTYGIKSEDIAEKLPCAVVIDGFENIAKHIIETATDGELVITMGGGDIYKAANIIEGIMK